MLESAATSNLTELTQMARTLDESGRGDGNVTFFARLGGSGRRICNVERNWHNRLKRLYQCGLATFPIQVPMLNVKGEKSVQTLHALAPHELFAALFEAGWDVFSESMFGEGGPGSVLRYWNELRDHRINYDSHLKTIKEWLIPTEWHSDGAEVWKGTDESIYSWTSSLVYDMHVHDAKWYYLGIDEDDKIPHETEAAVAAFCRWSLRVLDSWRFETCKCILCKSTNAQHEPTHKSLSLSHIVSHFVCSRLYKQCYQVDAEYTLNTCRYYAVPCLIQSTAYLCDMQLLVSVIHPLQESRVWPEYDWLGNKLDGWRAEKTGWLAGGWGATFSGHQADGKEKVKIHRFDRNYMCNLICERCLAGRHLEDYSAYNFLDNSPWRDTCITHHQYMAVHSGERRSPWANVEGWTIHRNRDDLLHVVYLGIGNPRKVCVIAHAEAPAKNLHRPKVQKFGSITPGPP